MCMYIFSVDSLKLVIKKLSGQPIPPPGGGGGEGGGAVQYCQMGYI